MRPAHLPDEALRPDDVPAPDAPWEEVAAFGHRFHAYRVAGSLQRVASLTLAAHEQWEQDGTLPEDLTRCRLALFHTVRASHGRSPAPDTEAWARALVTAIREQVRERTEPIDG